MYISKFSAYLVTLVLYVGLAACDEESVPPAAEPLPQWEEDQRFLYDLRGQYNAASDGNNLYLLGKKHLSHLELKDSVESVTHSILWMDYNQNHKMPVTSQISLTADHQAVRAIPNSNPVLGNSDLYLHFPSLDTAFIGFGFPSFHMSDCMAINSRNEFLVLYYARTVPEENIIKGLVVATTTESYGPESNYLDTARTWAIDLPGYLYALYAFGEDFYVLVDAGTYKINTTRTAHRVSDKALYKMFTIDGRLYGLHNQELYTSHQGDDWELVGNVDFDISLLNYQMVEDKTIAYYNSQLFHLEQKEGVIHYTELDNTGMESHKITSVARLGPRVYVTTLSGVFFKEYNSFLNPKEENALEE